MQKTITYCDVCNKKIKHNRTKLPVHLGQDEGVPCIDTFDLCPSCTHDLLEIIYGIHPPENPKEYLMDKITRNKEI